MNIDRISRWHLLYGLVFAVLGMGLGIYMASSQNHGQHVTHAHVLLLGFVLSALYAVIYRLWLSAAHARWALVQTVLHQVGAAVLAIGLFLLYGQRVGEAVLGPVLGLGSIAALLGMVVMLVMVWRAESQGTARVGAAAAAGTVS